MRELAILIKTVAEGLKSIAQGTELLAEKVEKIVASQAAAESEVKKPAATPVKASPEPAAAKAAPKAARKKAKPAPAKKKAAAKAPRKKAAPKKTATAAETVLKIIVDTKDGINTADLMKKTDFDQKKIANIVYKLKKNGQINSISKGLYVAS